MSITLQERIAAANAQVPRVAGDEARRLVAEEDAVLVDVRDPNEVAASGRLQGALAVSRGMLEFCADPDSSYHDAALRRDRPVVLYCAAGGRAALAGQTLLEMGFSRVYNLGGFADARDAGLATEPA